jgi:hypothetical protein
MWAGVFVEEHVSERVQLWFDGSWRRLDFGQKAQQLLLRPGILYTLAPGLRIGGGYSYIATATYGRLPIANPLREHRLWQDIRVSHKNGPVSFTHRYRFEQRWNTALVRPAGGGERERGPTTYQNRFRYLGRAQMDVPRLRIGTRPVIGFVWDEFLMPVGGNAPAITVGQNRATIGVGLPLDARQRVEVGYMNLTNMFSARRATEMNHTLWLSWHWTGAPWKKAPAAPAAATPR